jgi:hypothetical protein
MGQSVTFPALNRLRGMHTLVAKRTAQCPVLEGRAEEIVDDIDMTRFAE